MIENVEVRTEYCLEMMRCRSRRGFEQVGFPAARGVRDALVPAQGGPISVTTMFTSFMATALEDGRSTLPMTRSEYRSEDIADVRFVPLIGEEGWGNAKGQARAPLRRTVPPVSYVDAALAEILPTPQNHFRRSKRLISIR
jgi:hypothetical protein